ncbi:unnamed protein product, partial [Staurois parvus]
MVGMDLVQTGTRSRPLSAAGSGRGHWQGSVGTESDGKRQADLLTVHDPCGMDGPGREWSGSQARFSRLRAARYQGSGKESSGKPGVNQENKQGQVQAEVG